VPKRDEVIKSELSDLYCLSNFWGVVKSRGIGCIFGFVGGYKKFIQNFGGETSWKAVTWMVRGQ
jgi:hypothetical protein